MESLMYLLFLVSGFSFWGFIISLIVSAIKGKSGKDNSKDKKFSGTFLKVSIGSFVLLCILIAVVNKTTKEDADYGTTAEQKKETEQVSEIKEDNEKIPEIEVYEIYKDDDIRISTDKIKSDDRKLSTGNMYVDFLVENTSEVDYLFYINSYAVNGLMVKSNLLYEIDVPAEKKATVSVAVPFEWMKNNNVNTLAEIELDFSWTTDSSLRSGEFLTAKIKTSEYDDSLMYVPSGEIVYDNDEMTVWNFDNTDKSFSFAILNKTDYYGNYTVDNSSVNDWAYPITDYTYDLSDRGLLPDCYDLFTFSVDDTFIDEHEGLEEITSIEFEIMILEREKWDIYSHATVYTSDRIVIER